MCMCKANTNWARRGAPGGPSREKRRGKTPTSQPRPRGPDWGADGGGGVGAVDLPLRGTRWGPGRCQLTRRPGGRPAQGPAGPPLRPARLWGFCAARVPAPALPPQPQPQPTRKRGAKSRLRTDAGPRGPQRRPWRNQRTKPSIVEIMKAQRNLPRVTQLMVICFISYESILLFHIPDLFILLLKIVLILKISLNSI
ncbi:short-chain collagen C4-like [Papio anubis]|uniref:short-chain collagen C4-like n=1 Tax=Papio anubis TaxID=9555 RepID=UPI0012AE61AF|nr:short-chain collagen C4-like [Papio anubis]